MMNTIFIRHRSSTLNFFIFARAYVDKQTNIMITKINLINKCGRIINVKIIIRGYPYLNKGFFYKLFALK